MYRRDARVMREMERTFVRGVAGVMVLAPEVVVLYKSKGTREKDEADFRVVWEALDEERRGWLRGALGVCAPGHRWGRE